MKREREESQVSAMANCLMLLSKVGETTTTTTTTSSTDDPTKRVFACKTCNKEFPSFQALGGHRASHKKPKLIGGEVFDAPESPKKPKTHECSICGVEFAIGQALGGHMRRHRTALGGEHGGGVLVTRPLLQLPVLKKSNSSKRVSPMDLNMPPDFLKLWVA